MRPEELHQKRILFACFDWGLGHLTRSIPLIRQLEEQGNTICFVGNSMQTDVLRSYGFKGEVRDHEGANLRFKGDGNFVLEGIRNLFKGPRFIRRDLAIAKQLVRAFQPDVIISDHRYGFRHKSVHSVFLTHQVALPPETPRMVSMLHNNWLQDFSEWWVLDDPNVSLAGVLSASTDPKATYIGWYSRFQRVESMSGGGIVGIVSGPEPYADQLFELFVELARAGNFPLTIICSARFKAPASIQICVLHDWQEADEKIKQADCILSRNGYSTLMDLKYLQKPAFLLATPGQEEQIYLQSKDTDPQVKQFVDEVEYRAAVTAFARKLIN